MIRRCYPLFSLAILMGLFGAMMFGCSSDSSGSGGGGAPTPTKTPASIRVSATPDSINPGQTTTIKAVVYDASGNPIGGVGLVFTIDNPQVASVTDSATTKADGVATVTFKARDLAGSVIVTAAAGTVTSDPPVTVSILSTTAPTHMDLTVNPTAILVQGTASVVAQLLDSDGNPVPDGTTASFSSDNEIYGTFTSGTATTNGGFASATFEAAAQAGTATVTVRSGNLSEQTSITILPALAAALQFDSAERSLIARQGSGGVETAYVRFIVKDSNNNAVEGAFVSFVMTGPNGGEYIDPPPDETPKQKNVSTDANGVAQVILHSGTAPGPVNIVGTTVVADGAGGSISISAQSSVISIGGGISSAGRFSVAATKLNIAGFNFNGLETDITAYLADRFGNYNVLKGTTVSFVCEPGLAINANSVTLDETGLATVTARSQVPVLPASEVIPESWEDLLKTYIASGYGVQIGYPRLGACSILVYVRGEEHFDDTNANGLFDAGENFVDTDDDPFVDYNDNGIYDGPGWPDPQEPYIDAASNGRWDGVNVAWDDEKTIFANIHILLTSSVLRVRWSTNSQDFNVPNGATVAQGNYARLRLLVCDQNGNPPPAGSTLTVTTDNGLLLGTTPYTYPESSGIGPTQAAQLERIEFLYNLVDKDASTAEEKQTTVTATLNWAGGGGRTQTITSTVTGKTN